MVKYFVKGYVYVMYVVNMKKYFSKSPRETKKIAQNLAQKITKERTRKAVILSLEGELGSGKTTFLQGFARGLRVYEKIKSPSFVIMRKYSIRQSKTRKCLEFNFFYHFDAYRIEKPSEILNKINTSAKAGDVMLLESRVPDKVKRALLDNLY